MRNNPFYQLSLGDRTIGKPQAQRCQFFVCAGNLNAICFKENNHNRYANALVSIKKGMVLYEGISEVSCFINQRWIQIMVTSQVLQERDDIFR